MSRIRVLVVDDSVVVRRMVTSALGEDPDIHVVGTASNGQLALDKIALLAPDIITLDIEMPVMDGLTTLRHLRRDHRKIPVIMFSTLTERAASATLDALAAGAADYVTKPANVGSVSMALEAVRLQLVPKIRALSGRGAARQGVPAQPAASRGARPHTRLPVTAANGAPARPGAPITARPGAEPIAVLAIGSSTGGPDALASVIPALGSGLRVPVVIVQHMPPVFTRLFAERLNKISQLTVREAAGGEMLRAGEVLIAPGDYHMTLRRERDGVRTVLNQGTPENFCRPAVDVLFRSVAQAYGPRVLAVVLTGMGQDGARGCENIRAAGGTVVAQDEASSVVWGMPGAVVSGGFADHVAALTQVSPTVLELIRSRGLPLQSAGKAL
jgi:two-component system chemotaxis response regulator CheB